MKIFWAWQGDTPGNVSRHFVRKALQEAIARLKQAEDIEEPEEASRRSALELDHDRKGEAGSPELANTILGKIEAASVFVADVTPVGIVRQGTERDDGT
jgi:hypothetical protein